MQNAIRGQELVVWKVGSDENTAAILTYDVKSETLRQHLAHRGLIRDVAHEEEGEVTAGVR